MVRESLVLQATKDSESAKIQRRTEALVLRYSATIAQNVPPETPPRTPSPSEGSSIVEETTVSVVLTQEAPEQSRAPTPVTPRSNRSVTGVWTLVVQEEKSLVWCRYLPCGGQEWLTSEESAQGEWHLSHTQDLEPTDLFPE
jgi:hypothetical protein